MSTEPLPRCMHEFLKQKLDDEKTYRQVSVAPHNPNYCKEFIIAALAKPSSS